RRSKSMIDSVLDPVAGLGPTRRKALIKTFGSVKKLRLASAEEIATVPGIGPATAQSIVEALAAGESAPAVNTATGEILEDR
ncbi:MAG: helix-hairpin-helix domain-containing protein, partial [Aeromicrobium sp.]